MEMKNSRWNSRELELNLIYAPEPERVQKSDPLKPPIVRHRDDDRDTVGGLVWMDKKQQLLARGVHLGSNYDRLRREENRRRQAAGEPLIPIREFH